MLEKSKLKRKKKGFTLVELIVVIVIIGILAAIAIPRLGGFRDSADDAQQTANARVLTSAAQMYAANSTDNELPKGTVSAVITELDTEGFIESSDFDAADYDYAETTGIFTVKP